MLVVGSRLHWNNHGRHAPLDGDHALRQVRQFLARAAKYGDAIVLAIGVPSTDFSSPESDTFSASVAAFLRRLHHDVDSLGLTTRNGHPCPVRLVPLSFWGQFVPALNAIVSTTATTYPEATHLLLQSLELEIDAAGIDHILSNFQNGQDLVVGAALPGHAFAPELPQPLVLDGTTTPWNTLALWDLRQLAKLGFPLVADGLGLDPAVAGVEEVATISLFQTLYPAQSHAKLIQVPGLSWHVQDFDDPERQAWQQRKMESKRSRPAKQLDHLQLAPGRVFHVQS